MNKPYITAILAVTSLSFSAGAMAQDISRIEYKAAEKNIVVEYKSAKANCASFAGNAKDICMAQAKGDQKVAKAELEARYRPSKKADYKVSVAEAEEHYAVSKEKCDDKSGKLLMPVPQDLDKFVCMKEAQAARRGAKSDAKGAVEKPRRQTLPQRGVLCGAHKSDRKKAAKLARTQQLTGVTRVMTIFAASLTDCQLTQVLGPRVVLHHYGHADPVADAEP